MEILFTQTAFPPSIGGAQTHLHQLSVHLSARHGVSVMSFWKEHRTDWLLGTTVRAPGAGPYVIDGVRVTPIHFSRPEKLSLAPWALGYYPLQGFAIDRIAALILKKIKNHGGDPDIVHHGRVGREPLGFASLQFARERNIPFVLTPYHHPRWGGWLHRHYQNLYRRADAVIALTPAEKETLVGLGVKPSRVFVLGHGPILAAQSDSAGFKTKYGLDGPFVLFLGQKYAYKGIEALIKAAPLVWDSHPKVKFVFVGPHTPFSTKLFSNLNDPRIIDLNVLSLEEKTAALETCMLLCVPSTQESFGGVFLEAWAKGQPVIGADIPAVRCVVENEVDGFLGQQEASFLAEKINLLTADPGLRQKLGEAGRRKLDQRYRWPVLAAALESVYLGLLGR